MQNSFKFILSSTLISLVLLLFIPAVTPAYTHYFTGFESGEAGWTFGGQDGERNTDMSYCTDTACNNGGSYSANIKDDTGTSDMEQTFDLSSICNGGSCDEVNISFWVFYENNIDVDEFLALECDGTVIWSCYPYDNDDPANDASECAGTGILDNWNYHEVSLNDPPLGNCVVDSSVLIRFESDFSGNAEESWIDGINITGYLADTTSPSVSIVYPQNTSYGTGVSELNYTASDDSSLDTCWYSLNGGSTNTTINCGTNITGISGSEGSNSWTFYANDTFGNENSTDVVFFQDSVYPLINYGIGTEDNDLNFDRDWIYVNVTVTETNEANITFRLYNSTSNVDTTSYTDSTRIINWTNLPNGNYSYNVTVVDILGNENSTSTRTLTLGSTFPKVTIYSPLNITYGNSTILVNFTADNYQALWYNNGSANITYNGALYETLSEGTHTYTFYANDSDGNLNVTSLTFSLDLTSPLITNILTNPSLPLNNLGNEQNITIDFNSSEYPANITFNAYSSSGILINTQGPTQVDDSDDLPINYSIPGSLSDGVFDLNMTASDSLGNSEIIELGNFTVDGSAPTITIHSPQNTSYVGRNITLNISTFDSVSGLSQTWYSLDGGVTNNTYSAPDKIFFNEGGVTLIVYSNDTFGNENSTSVVFSTSNDTDEDNISDTEDNLIFNESSVNGIDGLDIIVNGTTNVDSNGWEGEFEVLFNDSDGIFLNFTHNFTSNKIDLSKVIFEKTDTSLVVNLSGQLASGETKTLYIVDNSFTDLCVKDSAISSASEISSGCNGVSEIDFTSCLGNSSGLTIGNLTCYDDGNRIRVENLTHSGIRGTQETSQDSSSSSSDGGGGGGGSGCRHEWNCTEYGACLVSGIQSRTCENIGTCSDSQNPPETERTCVFSPDQDVALFDIIVELIESEISSPEDLSAKISLLGFRVDKINVSLNYTILDSEENLILNENETLEVGGQTEFIKKFSLPLDTSPGEYSLIADLTYPGQKVEAISKSSFKVLIPGEVSFTWLKVVLGVLGSLFFIAFVKFFMGKKKSLNNPQTQRRLSVPTKTRQPRRPKKKAISHKKRVKKKGGIEKRIKYETEKI